MSEPNADLPLLDYEFTINIKKQEKGVEGSKQCNRIIQAFQDDLEMTRFIQQNCFVIVQSFDLIEAQTPLTPNIIKLVYQETGTRHRYDIKQPSEKELAAEIALQYEEYIRQRVSIDTKITFRKANGVAAVGGGCGCTM